MGINRLKKNDKASILNINGRNLGDMRCYNLCVISRKLNCT